MFSWKLQHHRFRSCQINWTQRNIITLRITVRKVATFWPFPVQLLSVFSNHTVRKNYIVYSKFQKTLGRFFLANLSTTKLEIKIFCRRCSDLNLPGKLCFQNLGGNFKFWHNLLMEVVSLLSKHSKNVSASQYNLQTIQSITRYFPKQLFKSGRSYLDSKNV